MTVKRDTPTAPFLYLLDIMFKNEEEYKKLFKMSKI